MPCRSLKTFKKNILPTPNLNMHILNYINTISILFCVAGLHMDTCHSCWRCDNIVEYSQAFFKTDFRKKKKREICERLVGFYLLTKAGLWLLQMLFHGSLSASCQLNINTPRAGQTAIIEFVLPCVCICACVCASIPKKDKLSEDNPLLRKA